MNFNDDIWEIHKEKFSSMYDDAAYKKNSLQSWVMARSHQLIEKDFGGDKYFEKVLEIGAGTGEHLYHVKHQFQEYTLSDSNPDTLKIAKNKIEKDSLSKLRFDVQAADGLTYADATFDRVIATHVLEHIYYPHLAISEWCRVLKSGGILSIVIPTDPGIAWRLGKMLGPRKNALAKGIPYDYLMAREHVNSCVNLIAILRHHFPNCIVNWWPTRIASTDINLFAGLNLSINK